MCSLPRISRERACASSAPSPPPQELAHGSSNTALARTHTPRPATVPGRSPAAGLVPGADQGDNLASPDSAPRVGSGNLSPAAVKGLGRPAPPGPADQLCAQEHWGST